MRKPNVFVVDIETMYMTCAIWDPKMQGYLPANHVIKDRYIMAWGGKWYGQPKSAIRYEDTQGQGADGERRLLMQLWPYLDKADIVISYNGETFDSKRITAAYMRHGIKPPSPYRHYDVMKLHKRVADHSYNTLDYVSTNVNTKFKKLHHNEFPGIELWHKCSVDNPKAWKAMKKYNIHDVLSTEENCELTLAFAPESFPEFFPVSNRAMDCGRCGYHGNMRSVDSKLTNKNEFEQYRCGHCGSYQHGKKVKKK